jgi:hypothetical protein
VLRSRHPRPTESHPLAARADPGTPSECPSSGVRSRPTERRWPVSHWGLLRVSEHGSAHAKGHRLADRGRPAKLRVVGCPGSRRSGHGGGRAAPRSSSGWQNPSACVHISARNGPGRACRPYDGRRGRSGSRSRPAPDRHPPRTGPPPAGCGQGLQSGVHGLGTQAGDAIPVLDHGRASCRGGQELASLSFSAGQPSIATQPTASLHPQGRTAGHGQPAGYAGTDSLQTRTSGERSRSSPLLPPRPLLHVHDAAGDQHRSPGSRLRVAALAERMRPPPPERPAGRRLRDRATGSRGGGAVPPVAPVGAAPAQGATAASAPAPE